ncbi:MAG: hypothetical protein WAK17_24645 [Candidatus Nitrosopolaris sp.]
MNLLVFNGVIVQREKDDVKEFSRIATNTARTFENTSRDFGQ